MCLDDNNQQLWHCRRPEQLLNACVFDKLVRGALPLSLWLSLTFSLSGSLSLPPFISLSLSRSALAYTITLIKNPFNIQKLEKKIPGTPENETPVHLRDKQIFSHNLSSWRRKTERPKRGEVQAGKSEKAEKSEKPE